MFRNNRGADSQSTLRSCGSYCVDSQLLTGVLSSYQRLDRRPWTLGNFRELVVGQEVHPESSGAHPSTVQPESKLGADAGPAVKNSGEVWAGHAESHWGLGGGRA